MPWQWPRCPRIRRAAPWQLNQERLEVPVATTCTAQHLRAETEDVRCRQRIAKRCAGRKPLLVDLHIKTIKLSVNGDITTARPEPSTRR